MKKRLNENGHVIIFTTLAFVVLGFFVGMATDGGRGFLLKSELTRTVDAAAIAAAARITTGGLTAATNAACDAARMNGVEDCSNLVVTQVTVNDAAGHPKNAVQVSGTASTPTIFVRLGNLIGCGDCDVINVAASAVAAAGGAVELVMNLDDTQSISSKGWLTPLKTGAKTLVDAMVSTSGSSTTMVSMVPFRGCYNTTGASTCENSKEYSAGNIVSLSGSNTTLNNGINALTGAGGYGTNNCEGLTMAQQKLFKTTNPGRQTLRRKNSWWFSRMLQTNYSTTASFANCKPSAGGTANYKVNLCSVQDSARHQERHK